MYMDQDNQPFYIGKGKGNRWRPCNHSYNNSANPFLKRKIRKVGVDNIKIHFLHENLTEEEAFHWEKYWIKYIGRRDLKEGSLVNLTDGGEGDSGRICSLKHRQKIGVANRGKSAWNKGVPHTKEQKQKLSENSARKGLPAWNKGKKMSEEFRMKCRIREIKKKRRILNAY